jgi:hypothetical protein
MDRVSFDRLALMAVATDLFHEKEGLMAACVCMRVSSVVFVHFLAPVYIQIENLIVVEFHSVCGNMSRRRGGRSSRADRYGMGDNQKVDEDDNVVGSAPYQLATEDGTAPALPVGAPPDPTPTLSVANSATEQRSSLWDLGRRKKTENPSVQDVPSEEEPLSPQNNDDVFHDEPVDGDGDAVNVERGNENDDDDDDSLEGYDMTLQELMYSTSSFYAIVVPGTFGFHTRLYFVIRN